MKGLMFDIFLVRVLVYGALEVVVFLPARRYASAGLCDSDVTCPDIRPSHAGIVRKRCILDTKLLWDGNRKPYASYRMVSLSMTLSDP